MTRKSRELSRSALILAGMSLGAFGCVTNDQYADPGPRIKKLSEAQADAVENDVDVLSPKLFAESAEELAKAKHRHERGRDPWESLDEADAELKRAVETAKPARTALEETLKARDAALEADAPTYAKEKFATAEKQIRKATRRTDRGDLTEVQDERSELTTLYRNAEADAIVMRYLGDAAGEFHRAEEDGARRAAPKTYREVKGSLDAIERDVRANKYDQRLLEANRDKAKEAAAKLTAITADAKRLDSEKPAIEIWNKNQEAKVAQQKADEQKEATRQAQAAAKRREAEQTAASDQAMAAAAAEREALNQRLSEADQRLAHEREVDERYRKARELFRPNEADVYRDGDNLLIRLKGLQFATGKATLADANGALIDQVEEAIELFNQPTIKVEGHTDSTGSAATNVRLSDERAKTVKNAIAESLSIPGAKLSSEGFGAQRPIASNANKDGRAQNRRVDVIIMPGETGEATAH